MTEHLLSADEVAERFGWSRRTLLENVRRHGWQVVKIGRSVWFTETLYERILSKHTVTSKPPQPADGRTKGSRARATVGVAS